MSKARSEIRKIKNEILKWENIWIRHDAYTYIWNVWRRKYRQEKKGLYVAMNETAIELIVDPKLVFKVTKFYTGISLTVIKLNAKDKIKELKALCRSKQLVMTSSLSKNTYVALADTQELNLSTLKEHTSFSSATKSKSTQS